MNSEIFEKTPPTRLFFRCAIPAAISAAAGALYSTVDGIFMGRFIGEDALAAVNLVMPVIMIIFAIANMIATGASVRIAVLLGQKDRAEASRTFSFSVKVIFALSVLVGVLGAVFAKPILLLLAKNATEGAIRDGVTYLRIHALFMPLLPLCFATDNFLRICGKEKASMLLNVGTQLGNVVLDFVLIALLRQGIWAAAVASSLSIAIGTVISLFCFLGKKQDLYFTRGNIGIKRFARLLANGSSEFFSQISMSVMSLIQNFYLLHYGGTTAVAAFSVLMYVDGVVGMLLFGMCDALQPAISYCYGAGNFQKVKAIRARIIAAALVLSAISFAFMFFIGKYVAPLFIKPEDVALLEMSLVAMKIFSFSYFVGWVDMIFSSYFTAIEKPARSLALSFFGTLIFPIGCLMLLTPRFGLDGVWWMPTLAASLSAIVAVLLLATVKYEVPSK